MPGKNEDSRTPEQGASTSAPVITIYDGIALGSMIFGVTFGLFSGVLGGYAVGVWLARLLGVEL